MCDEQTHPSQTNIEGGSDLHVAKDRGAIFTKTNTFFQAVRRIMCTPESVSTTPLISPTFRANEA